MEVQTIELRYFRNYNFLTIKFEPGQNVIWGNNGEGKTSILEAIYFLALTKSFKTHFDRDLVKNGENGFKVQGVFCNRKKKALEIEFRFELPVDKNILVQGSPVEKKADIVGLVPVVCLSPDYASITKSGPEERRRWIDLCISQSDRNYLRALIEYRKALKHRNQLLLAAGNPGNVNQTHLETWNEMLIANAATIIHKRSEGIEKIGQLVATILENIIAAGLKSKIVYRPNITDTRDLREKLTRNLEMEINLGRTLHGPHRDEIDFEFCGKWLRQQGSQGEHKIFLIALKCAEAIYLEDTLEESPILLLDDIFSELDESRAGQLMIQLRGFGQTFITTTNVKEVPTNPAEKVNWLKVQNGTIEIKAA